MMLSITRSDDCAPKVVQALLERGANPRLLTVDGQTAERIAYKKALAGSQACNQVMALLQAPPRSNNETMTQLEIPSSSGGTSLAVTPVAVVLTGDWQGVFNATAPRQGTVKVTAVFADSGEVIFSSQSGMHGSGRMNATDGQVTGSFTAKAPDGTEVMFTLTGTIGSGIIRGQYTSSIERGHYAMCDSTVYQQTDACKAPQASAGDLLKAVGGLLGSLKGLSNSTR